MFNLPISLFFCLFWPLLCNSFGVIFIVQDLDGAELLRFDRPLRRSACLEVCLGGEYIDIFLYLLIFSSFFEYPNDLGACFCCDSCYPNWTQTITILHKNEFIGKVLEVPVCCSRKRLEVWDKNGTKLYHVTSRCCPITCGPSVHFQVISYDKKRIFICCFPSH